MLRESKHKTNIGTLCLEKPLMNASGTLSKENLEEVKDLYGALVTKTVTLEPRIGNPPPRVIEVTGGMINSIGLQNPGIEKFLEEELDAWDVGPPVIVSVGGKTPVEFERICRRLNDDSRVAAVELNLSCPNVEGHLSLLALYETVWKSRHALRDKPLICKLASELVVHNAHMAKDCGVDALTLINTIPALTWPPGSSEPMLGGLSGPAVKPIALRAVYEVSRQVKIPILACGGITCEEDIEEFFRARASCVQIGSGSFVRDSAEIVPTQKRRKRRR